MTTINKLFEAIRSKSEDSSEVFQSVMMEKVAAAIDTKREEITQTMFTEATYSVTHQGHPAIKESVELDESARGSITLGGKTHPKNRVPIEHFDEFKKDHKGSTVRFRGPRNGTSHTRRENATHFNIVTEEVELDEAKIDKVTAKEILAKNGGEDKDFFTLSNDHIHGLLDHAKIHKYKKSSFAPGSTARMFHQHLKRIVNKGE